jgi:hypothetical protein
LKDHQRLLALGEIAPVRVCAREMAFDNAEGALVLEDRRQVTGKQPFGAGRYERRKRPRAHERMQLFEIVDAKMIRPVHVVCLRRGRFKPCLRVASTSSIDHASIE